MKKFAVGQIKGGEGKTTLLAVFGVYQAHNGKRVLLVDMDPQASLTYMFLRERIAQVRPWFEADDQPVEVKKGAVWVLPTHPSQVLQGTTRQIRQGDILETLEASAARLKPDWVLVDTPGGNPFWAQTGFLWAGTVIVPTSFSIPSAISTVATRQMIRMLDQQARQTVTEWYLPWGWERRKAKWLLKRQEQLVNTFGEDRVILPPVPRLVTLERWNPLADLESEKMLPLREEYLSAFAEIERRVPDAQI